MDVARKGEESGYGVPFLLVSTKTDLNPYPVAIQDSVRVYHFSLVALSLVSHAGITRQSDPDNCKFSVLGLSEIGNRCTYICECEVG